MNLQPGDVVDRYQVETPIGEGGMARVYRVRHTSLGSLHALKLLSMPMKPVRDRLLQEGRVQASLRHENVVLVHDIVDIDGAPGLVMEYVDGPSLAALVKALHPLDLDVIDAIGTALLDGVQHAHKVGVVHRDLKPANVLLATDGLRLVPKVTDFGLAKLLSAGGDSGSTRSGVAMGTPSYMAPEQIRDSKNVGTTADIWSMGAILYELLTGRRAFQGDDVYDTYQQVMAAAPTPVEELRPDVPDRMRKAVEAALQRPIDARPPTVEELARIWRGDTPRPSGEVDVGLLQRAAALGHGGRPWSADSHSQPPPTPLSTSLDTYVHEGTDEAPIAAVTLPVLAEPAPPRARGWGWAVIAFGALALLGGLWLVRPKAPPPALLPPSIERPPAVPEAPVTIPELEDDVPAPVPAPPPDPPPPDAPPPDAPSPGSPSPNTPPTPPAPTPRPVPEAPVPLPTPPPTLGGPRIDVSGVGHVQLVNVVDGRIRPPGPVEPGTWMVNAFFDGATPTPTVKVAVGGDEQVQVRCEPLLGNCTVGQ